MTNTELKADELLPCPWCGGTAELTVHAPNVVRIACSNWKGCGVSPQIKAVRAWAIAAWNTRASLTPSTPAVSSEPTEGMVEAFEAHNEKLAAEYAKRDHDSTLITLDEELVFLAVCNMGEAIDALRAASLVPTDGWKLVPVEPTEAMIEAGCGYDERTLYLKLGRPPTPEECQADEWKVMLSAAPTPAKEH